MTPKRRKAATSTAAYVTFLRDKQKHDAEILQERFEVEKLEREIGIEKDRAMMNMMLEMMTVTCERLYCASSWYF